LELLGEFGESEISYFGPAVMDEYVGYFEISMDYIFLGEIIQSFENVLDDWFCFILIETSLLSQS